MWFIKKLKNTYTNKQAGFIGGRVDEQFRNIDPWILCYKHTDGKIYPLGGSSEYLILKNDHTMRFQPKEGLDVIQAMGNEGHFPLWVEIVRNEIRGAPCGLSKK